MTFARMRALAIIGVLAVSALMLVVITITKDSQTHHIIGRGCPPGSIIANLALPVEDSVKINVYNGSGRPGLANEIASEFKARKFKVDKIGNDASGKPVNGVAVLRYGPKMVGAAWVVRAYFLNEADMQFDIKRTDDVVDVALGTQFRQLATVTEVHQSLAQAGPAQLPDGTCDGGGH